MLLQKNVILSGRENRFFPLKTESKEYSDKKYQDILRNLIFFVRFCA